MSDNSWIWAVMMQQQAEEAARRRQQEEAAARAKAEADAAAAQAAEVQRQQQIAGQRQADAIAAQEEEAKRQAGVANRPGPVAPQDQYSPVGGTFFGQSATSNQGRAVGQILAPAQQQKQPNPSQLGAMFGQATQPQFGPGQQVPAQARNIGGGGGSSGAGSRIF